MKKTFKWIIVILLVLVFGAYGTYEVLKPLEVESFKIIPGSVEKTFTEEGTIKPVEESDVFATLPNKIISLGIKEGDMIHKGQMVALLDGRDFENQRVLMELERENMVNQLEKTRVELKNQIEQQELLINETNRQLELAKSDLNRIKELYINQSATDTQLETSENLVAQLDNNTSYQQLVLNQLLGQYSGDNSQTIQYYNTAIRSYEEQLKQLQNKAKDCDVTSPIDGIVKDVNYKLGSVINPQVPICTIFSPNYYQIEVFIVAEDSVMLNKGMKVDLIQEHPDEDIYFSGEIAYIAPSAVENISTLGLREQRVKLLIDIIEEKEAVLNPGYSVDVEFTTFRGEYLIAIPKTSIFKVDGKDTVWVIENDKAQIRNVTKGIDTDTDAVILEGLDDGDIIVRNPNIEELSQGKRVKAMDN